MPLADVCGVVAEPLQAQVVVGQTMAMSITRDVIDDAMAARVLAGRDRRTIGRAQRGRMEGVDEIGTLASDAIDMRSLHVRMAAHAHLVEAQIVD